MTFSTTKTVVIIVAHPDDETLWAGGTILSHPSWKCFIVCLCRGSDPDRAPKFYKTLQILQAEGTMGDLNDDPEQDPLEQNEVEKAIMLLLPSTHFDLIITHNSKGEYTKHLRHEETNKAVMALWHSGKIKARKLWTFAYEDGNKSYFPKAMQFAHIFQKLPEKIWVKKYKIITETYGYSLNSWETKTTPMSEAFWQYKNTQEIYYNIHLNIFTT
jgi:LmbE family N-acetylglucosaminyl deacetylase